MKLTLKAKPGATPISESDAIRFFGTHALETGERRGDVETRGPWSIISRYTALTVTATWRPGPTHDVVDEYTLHGDRVLSGARESGYNLEGYVSIDGRKRRAFTSSILFELPDGRLINVAVIHARG